MIEAAECRRQSYTLNQRNGATLSKECRPTGDSHNGPSTMNLADHVARVKRRRKQLLEIPFDQHDRSTTIGGSEAAAAVGIHEYKTPYKLWAEKTGLVPVENLDGNPKVEFGREMEPIIMRRFLAEQGLNYQAMDTRRITLVHPQIPWMSYSPDGRAWSGEYGVEIKHVGYRMLRGWGIEDTDDIPAMYLTQVAWGAILTRIPVWYIVATFGTEIRYYKYVHNPSFERKLLRTVGRFWNINVKRKIAPKLTSKEDDRKLLAQVFRNKADVIRDATNAESALLEAYPQAKQRYDDAKAEMEQLRNTIREKIGSNLGLTNGKLTATWKPSKTPGKRTWGWRTENRRQP